MLATFIRLENSFEKAMSVNESPQTVFHDYSGILLTADNPYPYIQRTYASDGIEIEDYEIEFFDMCQNQLDADIEDDTFIVVRNFQDPNTGLPQVEWQLNTNGLDFGNQLIYFRLNVGINGYIYSSPFTISSTDSEYTSQWWYRQNDSDTMLSIGLNMYFRNRRSDQTISVFTGLNTGRTIMGTSSINPLERWLTGVINIDIFEEFKKLFLLRQVYSQPYTFDGLPQFTRIPEALESKDPTADENFNDYEFLLSRNDKKTYDPLAGVIEPVPPPPFIPQINLTSVERVNNNVIRYNFTKNFDTTYLNFQWSLDEITWNTSTNGSTSPIEINVPNNDINVFYYRITHPMAISNVKSLLVKGITLNNPIKLGDWSYRLAYAIENYIPTNQLLFEQSVDGTTFRPAFYADGNDNPKDIDVAIGLTEPYFRVTDETEGLRSNIVQYTE